MSETVILLNHITKLVNKKRPNRQPPIFTKMCGVQFIEHNKSLTKSEHHTYVKHIFNIKNGIIYYIGETLNHILCIKQQINLSDPNSLEQIDELIDEILPSKFTWDRLTAGYGFDPLE